MSEPAESLTVETARYVAETRRLSSLDSTTEETFYPAIRELLTVILRSQTLPFEVRTGTSEGKAASTDRPDFVLADSGLFVGVFGEVKSRMRRSKRSSSPPTAMTRSGVTSHEPASRLSPMCAGLACWPVRPAIPARPVHPFPRTSVT